MIVIKCGIVSRWIIGLWRVENKNRNLKSYDEIICFIVSFNDFLSAPKCWPMIDGLRSALVAIKPISYNLDSDSTHSDGLWWIQFRARGHSGVNYRLKIGLGHWFLNNLSLAEKFPQTTAIPCEQQIIHITRTWFIRSRRISRHVSLVSLQTLERPSWLVTRLLELPEVEKQLSDTNDGTHDELSS